MKNILMIIPPERFRDDELFETKEELEKFGHKISINAPKNSRYWPRHEGKPSRKKPVKKTRN
jgi:hypothetical protein